MCAKTFFPFLAYNTSGISQKRETDASKAGHSMIKQEWLVVIKHKINRCLSMNRRGIKDR